MNLIIIFELLLNFPTIMIKDKHLPDKITPPERNTLQFSNFRKETA